MITTSVLIYRYFEKRNQRLLVGGIYTIDNHDGSFGIVKLLAHEAGICHVRVFRDKFKSRPLVLNLSKLSIGRIDDPEGCGIGHVPVREEVFKGWKPTLFARKEVTVEELEGYNYWKKSGGGTF